RGKEEVMACYNVRKMTCLQLTQVLIYYYTIYWNYHRICSAIGGMPPVVKRGAFLEMMADKVA
ncbi:MAG: hypothetical protein RR642_14275, partial [Solibacillus sp.]